MRFCTFLSDPHRCAARTSRMITHARWLKAAVLSK
jgi:hypothetical protein